MNLALFDFDGTITTKDSLAEFIKFAVGKQSYYFGLVRMSPILIKYLLKIISNDVAKEKLIGYFFQGWKERDFIKIADEFSISQIKKILRPKACKRIEWHKTNGDRIVIVSASIEYWIKKWCESQDIELIATKLEVVNNIITGNFLGKNCHGIEKVKRIEAKIKLNKYKLIYTYGDSSGDKQMLEIADEKHFKPF